MNCRNFLARHSEYIDGAMDSPAASLMSEHTGVCLSCARYDRIVRRGGELVRDLLPMVGVSPDFESRVRHRLFHVRDDMAQRRLGSATPFMAAASIVLVAAGAGALAFAFASEQVPPVADAQVVRAEAVAHRTFTPLEPYSAWPIYSPADVAIAFPAPGVELTVRPAEFRPTSERYSAGPILIRH